MVVAAPERGPENAGETKDTWIVTQILHGTDKKTYQGIVRHVDLIYRPGWKTIMDCVKKNILQTSPDGLLEQGSTTLPNVSYTNTTQNDAKLYQSSAMHIHLIYGLEEKIILACVRRNNFAIRPDNPLEQGFVKLFVLFRHTQETNYKYFYTDLYVRASTFF